MPDLTPAQLLAATATDMRKVADDAVIGKSGVWAVDVAIGGGWASVESADGAVRFTAGLIEVADHVAAWDPDMARAVADWLDAKATKYGAYNADEQARMVGTGTGTLAPMLRVCDAWWKSRGIEPKAVKR